MPSDSAAKGLNMLPLTLDFEIAAEAGGMSREKWERRKREMSYDEFLRSGDEYEVKNWRLTGWLTIRQGHNQVRQWGSVLNSIALVAQGARNWTSDRSDPIDLRIEGNGNVLHRLDDVGFAVEEHVNGEAQILESSYDVNPTVFYATVQRLYTEFLNHCSKEYPWTSENAAFALWLTEINNGTTDS